MPTTRAAIDPTPHETARYLIGYLEVMRDAASHPQEWERWVSAIHEMRKLERMLAPREGGS